MSSVINYREILRDLMINSILLHTKQSIDPDIYVDWLILDDDNADLSDGTPHGLDIFAGFDARNMAFPDAPEGAGQIYTWTDGAVGNQNFNDLCNWAFPPCGTDYPQNIGDVAYIDVAVHVDLVDATIRKLVIPADGVVEFGAASANPTLQVKSLAIYASNNTDVRVKIEAASGVTIKQPSGP